MRKLFKILGLFLLILGCNQENGEYYFDFDRVDHFFIQVNEDELFTLYQKGDLNQEERLKLDIILNDKPKEISDSTFVLNLSKIGFTKEVLNKNQLTELNEIFRKKSHSEIYTNACESIYRDLLIFRKDNSIVGIAKICFECTKHQILGTSVNSSEFGQSGDYERLHRLLHKNGIQ